MSGFRSFPRKRICSNGKLTVRCQNLLRELAEKIQRGDRVPKEAGGFLLDVVCELALEKGPQDPEFMTYEKAVERVAKLNKEKFGGHGDWRLPEHSDVRAPKFIPEDWFGQSRKS